MIHNNIDNETQADIQIKKTLFLRNYNQEFTKKYGYFRPVISNVVNEYLNCGI